MEFKIGDKVISKFTDLEYTVLENTNIDSPDVKLTIMIKGKYYKTITQKNNLTKKD